MNITYYKQAVKVLERMDAATKQRMRRAIEGIPKGDIKKLQGYANSYRLRIGGYRVLFTMSSSSITIDDVLPRGDAYKE
jgi:mRNA interferase RelE/StbE